MASELFAHAAAERGGATVAGAGTAGAVGIGG